MPRTPLLLLVSVLAAACYPEVDKSVGEDTGPSTADDADGDGFVAPDDCDDHNSAVHPGAVELCDGLDNDCNGEVDPDTAEDATPWYADADADGYGDPTQTGLACTLPEGTVANADDCDDGDEAVHPFATEVCDEEDNDCDGLVDADDDDLPLVELSLFYADLDGDGWGDEDNVVEDCFAPPDHLPDMGDCDDTRAEVNPDAQEVCDDLDNDCDGLFDEDDPSNDPASIRDFYADADGDGYGAGERAFEGCSGAEGFAPNDDDCNDSDIGIHPAATEVCDEFDLDEDCNGAADDADAGVDATTAISWYIDADADGYGDNDATATLACDDPSTATDTWVADDTDCDDTNSAVNPDAREVCDEDDVDEDCDGLVDDADTDLDTSTRSTWTVDADGDGFGDRTATGTEACDDPSTSTSTYVTDANDCDDTDSTVNPDAQEVCDAADTDEDCDGLVDDADDSVDPSGTTTWYTDADADGYGDSGDTGTAFCDSPASGYAATDDDCEDADPDVNPGATEVCNQVDDDCDASTTQDGMVRFVDTGGTQTDLASSWGAGTASAPADWSSSADGTLWVCADTWYVALAVGGDAVDIIGPDGASSTVLDAGSDGSVVTVSSASVVSMSGLTLQNGAQSQGAGVYVDTATFQGEDLVFTDNVASAEGGGLYALDSDLSLTSCTLEWNEAASGGGAYIDGDGGSPIVLDSSTVNDNLVSARGGGLYIKGGAEVGLLDTDVSDNEAGEHGGGIYFDNGVLDLDTCTIDTNTATLDGGGIFAKDDLTALDSSIQHNTAGDDGGGLYIDIGKNEDIVLTGSIPSGGTASSTTVSSNAASDLGDGIYIKISNKTPSGTLTVTTVDFDTDDVYHDTRSDGTVSPGDGASLSCTHNDGCS